MAPPYHRLMSILLSHTTALEVLRSPSLRNQLARQERCVATAPAVRPTTGELSTLAEQLPNLSFPLHSLVSPAVNRRPGELSKLHSSELILPADSAIELAPGLLCASPEHLVVQMAPLLTHLELIFLLGELLGIYAIAPDLEDGMFKRREALTTPELVRRHLALLGAAPGTAKVERALAVACINSGSPYETRLSMRVGLKPALGGCHLHVLSMNEPLEVNRIVSQLGTGIRKPDVFLGATHEGAPFAGVAFDYHGKIHEKPEQITSDLGRQNELLGINFKIYTFDKSLYDNLDYFDGIIRLARRDLGMPREKISPAECEHRRTLRQQLHDELEIIDGVTWNGKYRAQQRLEQGDGSFEPVYEPVYEPVPDEAYGF